VNAAGSRDEYVEVQYESWFSRVGDSIFGVVIGVILTFASPFLLGWNEKRAFRRATALKEGAGAVRSVESNEVDPANDGQLVHVVAKAVSDADPLYDATFQVYGGEGLKLERKVEMYQWKESTSSTSRKDVVGGGKTTTTKYSYEKEWSSTLHNSSGFKISAGHQNPSSMPFQAASYASPKVRTGAFLLSQSLVDKVSNWQDVEFTGEHKELETSTTRPCNLIVHGNTYYIGHNPNYPEVGDVRVSFRVCPPTVVSIIARQSGEHLTSYTTSTGDELELLDLGELTTEKMFQKAESENAVLTWILRVVFFLLQWLGIYLIFNPIGVVAEIIPIFGWIVGQGIATATFLLAAVISAIVVSVVWFGYRIWFFLFGTTASRSTTQRKVQ